MIFILIKIIFLQIKNIFLIQSYIQVKVKEDRVRIMKLLKLAEPMQQTVRLYHDKRPQILEKYCNEDFRIDSQELMENNFSKTVRLTSKGNRSFFNETISSQNLSTNKNTKGMSSSSSSFYIKSQKTSNKNYFNKSCRDFSFANPKLKTKSDGFYKNINTHVGCSKSNCKYNNNNSGSSRSNSKKNNFNKNFSKTSVNKFFSPQLEMRIAPIDEKKQILRTIILPNEKNINSDEYPNSFNNDSLNEENEFLRKQLKEMKNYYENLINKYIEDIKIREDEYKLRLNNNKQIIEDLMLKNNKLEKNTYEITKDYMNNKFDFNKNEKKLFEEIETHKLQIEALTVSLDEIVKKFNLEKDAMIIDYERKIKEISTIMRNQVYFKLIIH